MEYLRALRQELQAWLEEVEIEHKRLERTDKMKTKWPDPTTEEPDLDELEEIVLNDGACQATDGCYVEPDGVCEHGHPSWLLKLGMI